MLTWNGLLVLFLTELKISTKKFSVVISNAVNISRYNTNIKELCGLQSFFKNV